MQLGWIKLHRQILDWEWYSDNNCFRLFIHLLLTANVKDKAWQGTVIKRGQLVTSRQNLAIETGLTEQQIRTAIKRLKSTNEITSKTTSKYTVVTIVNYEVYQSVDMESNQQNNQQINQQTTSDQPASNQQITTTKESKKERMKEYKKEGVVKELCDEYAHYMGRFPSAAVAEYFESYLLDGMEPGVIRRAIYKANDGDARDFRYIKGILNSCMAKGILTEKAFLDDCKKWDNRKQTQTEETFDYTEVWANDTEGI